MTTIWKSVLEPVELQALEVPVGAELLCAKEQHEKVCVWYRCNPDAPKERRGIVLVGTGHPCPVRDRYLGTAALVGGELMLHVFEQIKQ